MVEESGKNRGEHGYFVSVVDREYGIKILCNVSQSETGGFGSHQITISLHAIFFLYGYE